jgi:hypothetical protein
MTTPLWPELEPEAPAPRARPPDRFVVILDERERELARSCAELMQRRGIGQGRADRWGARNAANDLLGSAGEVAFARLAGLAFECKPLGFSKPDVGRYQVRTSRSYPFLVVRENDPDDGPVVAMAGNEAAMAFRLVGWLPAARAGKRPEWHRDPGGRRPAWFVPFGQLEPAGTLPELLRAVTTSTG